MDQQQIVREALAIQFIISAIGLETLATFVWLFWRMVSAHENIATALYTMALHSGRSELTKSKDS